jgi:hypothetical protein
MNTFKAIKSFAFHVLYLSAHVHDHGSVWLCILSVAWEQLFFSDSGFLPVFCFCSCDSHTFLPFQDIRMFVCDVVVSRSKGLSEHWPGGTDETTRSVGPVDMILINFSFDNTVPGNLIQTLFYLCFYIILCSSI